MTRGCSTTVTPCGTTWPSSRSRSTTISNVADYPRKASPKKIALAQSSRRTVATVSFAFTTSSCDGVTDVYACLFTCLQPAEAPSKTARLERSPQVGGSSF